MMGDIAAIFHWPPSVMDAMDLGELIRWHGIAVARWNRMHAGEKE